MSSRVVPHAVDSAALADELARLRVVEADRMTDLLAGFPGGGPAAFAEFLVSRGALTPFQADRALAGDARLLILGPYRLTAAGGPGPFGPAYLATRDDRPGRTFRVGVLPLRSLWRARQAKQLARALADAPHPATVPMADADSGNGFHYLAWPHAAGRTLAERVTECGPLPPGEAAGLLAHLADALHACHARGVVHGAVTPRAVVPVAGLPWLLDLGAGAVLASNLADESLLDTLSAATAADGVLAYAAPEFAADPNPTPAADQYALGAVGYFALSGHAPFPDPNLAAQLAAKLAGPPTPLDALNPDVPPELAAVLDRMLAPSPADRFPGLEEVRDLFVELAASAPSTSAPAGDRQPVESLHLSTLRDRRSSGPPSWPELGSALAHLPTRDDSDASINFELPVPDPSPDVESRPAEHPLPPMDTPTRGSFETRPVAAVPPPFKPPPARPDPRAGVGAPIQYHTESEASENAPSGLRRGGRAGADGQGESVLWRRVKRNLLFWRAVRDTVQISVFGPTASAPGRSTQLAVVLHTPDKIDSVRTLARAFQQDAELIGTAVIPRQIARETRLVIHLTLANAGVSKSLIEVVWQGRSERAVFDLHVPWEAPSGPAPGLVSVGHDDTRVGKVEFRLNLLPRKG